MLNPTVSSPTRTAYLRPHWWVYLLNGLLTILFGVLALIWPGRTLVTLTLLFGVFAIVSGVSTLISSLQARSTIPTHWGWLFLLGALSIIAGIAAIVWPGLTLLTLVNVIAAWAIISGVVEIVTFFRMRDHAHQLWMILTGIASILFGVLAFIMPGLTLEFFITLIAVYAIFAGIMRIIFAFQVRSAA